MRIFTVFPLLIIPVIVYNVIAWGGSTFASAIAVRERMDKDLLSVPMASGAEWIITPGATLVTLGLIMLFFELLKSVGTGRSAIMNHAFSMILFIVCLMEFLLFPAFATSVFFLIMLMTLLDVMAGFIITIVSSRRDLGIDGGFVD
ncbi:MAG: hypothetical protein ACPGVT_03005 [Maricaulaceae bacterium]